MIDEHVRVIYSRKDGKVSFTYQSRVAEFSLISLEMKHGEPFASTIKACMENAEKILDHFDESQRTTNHE